MALSQCGTATDERERELKAHGSPGFPVAVYHDDIFAAPVPWHWHDELEAAIVESGSCLFKTSTEEILMKEGEAVFLNANVLHMCVPGNEDHSVLRSIVFSPFLVGGERGSIFWEKYLNPLCHEPGFRVIHLTGKEAWQKEVVRHVLCAWEACAYEPNSYEITLRNELSLFIALIRENIHESRGASFSSDSRYESRIKQMLSFIHNHYSENINTSAIAASANVSESETLRCFKRTLGITPIRYLLTYRLEKAESLLLTTELMVSEVGERCGFQEMSYFAKAFRKQYGCSPKEYRSR